jgi:molybdopterin-containing oxidoreductase family molybdopterin binding subunit
MGQEKVVYTACLGWGCHEQCVLETHVVDGKIERTQRAVLLGALAEDNRICQKGIVAGEFPYLPQRLRYPLKRTGERGEGKFEQIYWEQAFDEIGTKLNQIREKYGSQAVVVNPMICGYPVSYSSVEFLLMYRFGHAFGASMLEYESVDNGDLSMSMIDYGNVWSFQTDPKLMSQANHIILWGGNPIGFSRAARVSNILMDAQERGVKLVDIGVLFDSTAAKVDQFVPIKPGTDAVLALAMVHLMIEEKLYDEKFINTRTVAPFLVREDNGKFLRESDILPNGNPAKYIYWDKSSGKPEAIGSQAYDFGKDTPDLSAKVVVNGIACKTAFLKLTENVAEWTPESQEAVTGVPSETARQILYEYVANKPSALFLYYGLRYKNGTTTSRAIDLLPILSGNLAYPGGRPILCGTPGGYPVQMGDGAILFPLGLAGLKAKQVSMIDVLNSFKQPETQQYKALLNVMGNPVQNWPNRDLWKKEFFPNMELVVNFEVRMTDTSMFSDYVLPEANIFERDEIICSSNNCIVFNEAAIEPQGEAKPPADIWRGLSKPIGLGPLFDKTTDEWLELKLQSHDPGITGVTPPITLERLKKDKIIRLNVPDNVFDPFESLVFGTPSGRVEFYVEELAEFGEAMGKFKNPQILGPRRKEYPLQYFPGRHRFFMQGQFTEFSKLRELAGKKSVVALNPITAAERGLKDGDLVEIFNQRGTVRGELHLSQTFPPGMAHICYSYPSNEYTTNPPQSLSTAMNTPEAQDPALKKFSGLYFTRGMATGTPDTLLFFGQSTNDTIWDDVCDVRKVEDA